MKLGGIQAHGRERGAETLRRRLRLSEPCGRHVATMRPDNGVGRERFREDFERHVSVELGVAGAVDLAHPDRADLGSDGVGTEGVPGLSTMIYSTVLRSPRSTDGRPGSAS